jgi:hypothetical protein
MRFILAADATTQIHFIDIIAIGDVQSDYLLVGEQPRNAMAMEIRDVTVCRGDQP